MRKTIAHIEIFVDESDPDTLQVVSTAPDPIFEFIDREASAIAVKLDAHINEMFGLEDKNEVH